MNATSEPAPVLVTGLTGRTGTRIARRLTNRQTPVRIGTRNSRPPLDCRACGLEWTVLRCSWFAQNFSENAEELSAATGRPIEFVPCTAQEFAADLVPDGIPAEDAMPLAELFTEILDGRNASLTADLARALGGKSTDFTTYANRAAATGVWTEPAEVSLR